MVFQSKILAGVIVLSSLCFQTGAVIVGHKAIMHVVPLPPYPIAIYSAGTRFVANSGADSFGNAYVDTELGKAVTFNGSTISFGPPNAPDVYSNRVVNVAAGTSKAINMVAVSTGGVDPAQTFTLNFADGSSTPLTINMSDWAKSDSYSGETIVKTVPDYINWAGYIKPGSRYVYGYTLPLPAGRTLKSISLPANRHVIVFGFSPTN